MNDVVTRNAAETALLKKAERATILKAPRFAKAMQNGDDKAARKIAGDILGSWDRAVDADGPINSLPHAHATVVTLREQAKAVLSAVNSGKKAALAAFTTLLLAIAPAHASLRQTAEDTLGEKFVQDDTLQTMATAIDWALKFLQM